MSDDDLREAELVQAFLWTCDNCGRDNFERAVTLSPESIEVENLAEQSRQNMETIQDWVGAGGQVEFTSIPAVVVCKHCGSRFRATEG